MTNLWERPNWFCYNQIEISWEWAPWLTLCQRFASVILCKVRLGGKQAMNSDPTRPHSNSLLREVIQKKTGKKRSGGPLGGGGGGHPPPAWPLLFCENFVPFFSFIKWQNNPKYDNLSKNFHIFLVKQAQYMVAKVVQEESFLLFQRAQKLLLPRLVFR